MVLLPLAAGAAETTPERGRLTPDERQARVVACKADTGKCRGVRQVRFDRRFNSIDANGDGLISLDEAKQALPRMVRYLERIDGNHDGQIFRDEIAAARKAHFARRPGRSSAASSRSDHLR